MVLILQGRRGLLLELQQARAPRPHQVFGAVQATSDRHDILINNAGIGAASLRQTSTEGFETESWPVGIFRRPAFDALSDRCYQDRRNCGNLVSEQG